MSDSRPDANQENRGPFRIWAVILLIAAAILVVVVLVLHFTHLSSARDTLAKDSADGPAVEVVKATASPAMQTVTVLASITPYQQATLYAKVSGYLGTVAVDKGDHVKAGQLLATVQSQETDAQYESARADYLNKQQIAARYDSLLREKAVAALTADQADADARVAKATLDQDATLKAYERLVAPFDGVVVARFADAGQLVQNAETSQTSAQPVVTIADATRLRIDAYVQQDVAPFVHAGDIAQIVDAANSGRSTSAPITSVSGSLDPRTRTMLVEIVLDNKGSYFLAGSFVYLTLKVPVTTATEVPVGALITKGNDQYVAVLEPNSRLHYVKIAIARTNGDVVTLAGGIAPGAQVAVNLPSEATDGSLVHVAQPAK